MRPADEHHQAIPQQVATIGTRIGIRLGEDPAEVSVEEAVERAMGVARAIRQRVVLGVRRRPRDGVSLQGHRAEDEQNELDGRMRAEAAVGQHAMIADGDAEGDQRVERRQQREVRPMHRALP